MSRTVRDRLNAIPGAIAERDAFLARVESAHDNREWLADLMAEAIDMHLASNGLETVSRDGRAHVTVEDIAASHCMKAAKDAYRNSL